MAAWIGATAVAGWIGAHEQTGWWLILKGEPTDLTLGYRILTATSDIWVRVWMGTARCGMAV